MTEFFETENQPLFHRWTSEHPFYPNKRVIDENKMPPNLFKLWQTYQDRRGNREGIDPTSPPSSEEKQAKENFENASKTSADDFFNYLMAEH